MDENDESEKLRNEDDDWNDANGRREDPGSEGAACIVGITSTITSYPQLPNVFYGITPTGVTGPEVEGGPGTVTTSGSKFKAFNLGTTVPPLGTQVICTFVPYRWVFRYDA